MVDFTRGIWDQHKLFLGMTLQQLDNENRHHRLTADSSSAGFWLQHVSESKLALMQLFWGIEPPVPIPTCNGAHDTGQAGTADEIRALNDRINKIVEAHMDTFSAEAMGETHDTFLGPMTVSQMFGVMIYHTYYHMGQASLALKKGKQPSALAMASA